MDTNSILRKHGFGGEGYGEIARWVAGHQWEDEQALVDAVTKKFGQFQNKKIGMLQNSKPLATFADMSTVEPLALEQMYTALKLPVAVRGAIMPDVHPGYSLPIGGVVELRNAVSPAFVGYDISCMMHLSLFDIEAEVLDNPSYRSMFLESVLNSTSFGLGAESLGNDHDVMYSSLWNEVPILRSLKPLAQRQLGSSGAGNHFADVMAVQSASIRDGVALLTHSGSRGLGNKVARHYAALAEEETKKNYKVPAGYGWLELDSELGQEYMIVLNLVGRYAEANHEIIHKKFMKCIGVSRIGTVYNNHNFAWITNRGTVIHRKGATPASLGRFGIIPGSSGSMSYLVSGKGNYDSLESASHGAGRPRSRSASKKLYNKEEFERHMTSMGITYHGVAEDETVAAYKDIEDVMGAQKELVTKIATLVPKVVVMGGGVSTDDGD